MKRLAFIAAWLLASSAMAQQTIAPGYIRMRSESQLLTRAAPSDAIHCLSASPVGLDLRDVRGYRVIVVAESGQTLSGGGTLRAYLYDFFEAAWVPNEQLDISMADGKAGVRRNVFADIATMVRAGCVMYAADGVTVSGGTTVTIRMVANTEPRP